MNASALEALRRRSRGGPQSRTSLSDRGSLGRSHHLAVRAPSAARRKVQPEGNALQDGDFILTERSAILKYVAAIDRWCDMAQARLR